MLANLSRPDGNRLASLQKGKKHNIAESKPLTFSFIDRLYVGTLLYAAVFVSDHVTQDTPVNPQNEPMYSKANFVKANLTVTSPQLTARDKCRFSLIIFILLFLLF